MTSSLENIDGADIIFAKTHLLSSYVIRKMSKTDDLRGIVFDFINLQDDPHFFLRLIDLCLHNLLRNANKCFICCFVFFICNLDILFVKQLRDSVCHVLIQHKSTANQST